MERISLPNHHTKNGLFLALLLQGHHLWIENWTGLTGNQNAPQRAFDLRNMGLPVREIYHPSPMRKYKGELAFYFVDRGLLEVIGKERAEGFIERVQKHFAFDARIKKGLQTKPQPLKSILAGKLDMEGDL